MGLESTLLSPHKFASDGGNTGIFYQILAKIVSWGGGNGLPSGRGGGKHAGGIGAPFKRVLSSTSKI